MITLTHSLPVINPKKEDLGPSLAARIPPVMAPLPMEFQGSSLPRTAMRAQSKDEYMLPHTPKLPAAVAQVQVHAETETKQNIMTTIWLEKKQL